MKYVIRTSLVWLVLIACAIGLYRYRVHTASHHEIRPYGVQPLAAGPASSQPAITDTTPNMQSEMTLAPVQLTPERMQSIGVQAGTVKWKQVTDHIRATGAVAINERLVSYVQVRFSGYIRKVLADATYQFVNKGDPLFTIYSPELVAAQNEYLLALQNEKALDYSSVDGVASGAAALTTAAEARLRQWGISQAEITALKETRKAPPELEITSPVSGYITERNAVPNLYVEPATRLYSIADLSRVWIYAQIFQDDVGRLKPGDPARITVDSYSGRVFLGRIESILPQVDMATRTVRVRLDIANQDLRLKPGMFVNADFETNLGRQLVVPASAVLQSGEHQIAFLDLGGGRLEPKEVVVGPRAGDELIIAKGLSAGERVVTSANFLVDSESQLQAAVASYLPPSPGASTLPPPPSKNPPVNIEFTTDPAMPRKGNNILRVKLTGANGTPVTGADVSVTFYMPAMPAMGMAAMTTTVKLNGAANGVYEGTGLLQSGGTWQVSISARKNGQHLASKQMHVSATGGM